MLVTLNPVLRAAQHHKFAVGAFNVYNLESVEAVISAAEEMHAPVVVQTSEKAITYAGMSELAAIVLTRAKASFVPVVFHVDHGRTHRVLYDAIEAGYSSIMFDGSHLPYEENVRWTKEMVDRAHRKGISVEAELGRVGGVEDDISAEEGLTDPGMAVEFIRATHCDALAVGIGNNHGKPKPGEKLHLDQLEHIAAAVSLPLVLHGASGTPEDDIRQAIALGITKINIDTDLRIAFSEAEREVLASDPKLYDPRSILAPGTEAMREVVKQKIALFGGHLKAKYC
ncbi:MAG TPA: class II fructose-bisphosphate aldolase [Patescibacteria group bacterium]